VVAMGFPVEDMSVGSEMNKAIESIEYESSMILAFIMMQKKSLVTWR
jgi:hypothetical protein